MSDKRTDPGLGAAAIRGLRWSAIARPVVEILLLGSMVVLAHLITPAEFGRYAVALIVGEIALNVPNEGVGSALVQRKTITREHLQTGFALSLLICGGLAVLTFLLAGLAIEPILGARTADLVRWSIPAFAVAAVATVPSALLRRRLKFGTLSVLEIVSAAVRATVAVGLAIAGMEAEAMVLAGLLSGVAVAVIAFIAAPVPWPRLRIARAREIMSYGLPASVASISWVGFRNCDYVLIGARLGATQAGYYFRSYSLAVEHQKKLGAVMGAVAFPILSRATDLEEIIRLRTQMVRMMTILIFPLLLGLAILAPQVVPWVFGDAWEPAVLPTQILVIGGAATLISDAAGAALMAAGRARSLLFFGWAHFLVYAACVFAFAPLGLAAVAIVAAVVHTAFLGVAYALMLRGSGYSVLGRLWQDSGAALVSCVGFAVAALPTYLALVGTGIAVPALMLAVGLAGGSAYVLTLRALFPEAWTGVLSVLGRVIPFDRLPRPRSFFPTGARQTP